jgi:hypothetical protein
MHAVRLGWLAAPRPGLRCTRHANRETQASLQIGRNCRYAGPLNFESRTQGYRSMDRRIDDDQINVSFAAVYCMKDTRFIGAPA